MDNKTTTKTIKTRGGARPGAGRKKGGTNNFTIETLMEAVEKQSGGRPYEALLVEDFLQARDNDRQLAQKYHNLILSKVAPSLQKIETIENTEQVDAKAQAFADALIALTTVNKGK